MTDDSEDGVVNAIRSRYAARLGVALLAAVLLLVLLGAGVHAYSASEVREDARNSLETSAAVQSDEVAEWAEGNRRQARTVSQLPTVRSDNHSRINSDLAGLVEQGHVSDEVVAIHVISKQEEQIIASSRPDMFVGVSPAEMDEPFVPKLQEGFAGPDEVYVSQPFHIPLVEFPIVAMLSPVPGEDRVVVFMINPTGEVGDLRQPIESGQTHVVTADGNAVAAPNNTTITGAAADEAIDSAMAGETGVVVTEDGNLMGYAPVGAENWVVFTHVERSEAFAMIDTVRNGIGGMVLVALLTLGVVGMTIGRNTATALQTLADDARELGEDNLSVTFDVNRSDEIGTLAATLAEARDSIAERIQEVEEERARTERLNQHLETKADEYRAVMRDAADGDFTRRMNPQGESEAMTEIAREFNEMIAAIERTTAEVKQFADEVTASSEEVTASAEEVQSSSEQVSRSVQEISAGAERQNQRLRSVTDEIEDLSSTTEEIASSSNGVADLAERTAKAGIEGRDAAQEAIEGMHAIEADAEETVEAIDQLEADMSQIDDLLDLIEDVTKETNLLALNANIEATRSMGENPDGSAEGFTAVADQIKELATETKDAAEQIEERLENIKVQTNRASEEVESTSDRISEHTDSVQAAVEALEEIAEYAQETNNGVQEISAVTEQQAASTQQVVAMVDEVADISEQTAGESEDVASAAEEQTATLTQVTENATQLSSRADELRRLLAQFDVGSGQRNADGSERGAGSPVVEHD